MFNINFEELANKFGFMVVGGIIGAIIHRIRTKMTFIQFIGTIITSAFVGVIVGIFARNYLKMNEELIFAVTSTAGVFSKDILEQIEYIINHFGKFLMNLLKSKTSINNDKEEDLDYE